MIRGNGGRDGVIMGEGTEWLRDEGQSYHGKRDRVITERGTEDDRKESS